MDVPPVDEWPERMHAIVWRYQAYPPDASIIITRTEAEELHHE